MKIFITGNPGVGKTTLLKRINEFCKERGISTCGFITEEVRKNNVRVGFVFVNLKTGEKFDFASTLKETPYKFGKYYLDIERFDFMIEELFSIDSRIFILDEIGKMEFFSEKFKEKLFDFLNKDKNVIASLHRDFVPLFKKYGKICYLTYENREILRKEIEKEIINI